MFKRIGVVLLSVATLAISPTSFAKQGVSCGHLKQLVGQPDVLKASFTENQIHACTGGVVIWVKPYVRQDGNSLVPGHWEFHPGSPVRDPARHN